MRLSRLSDHSPGNDPEIAGLTQDSRAVRAGWLFAALAGARADGGDFIEDAVRSGAAAVRREVADFIAQTVLPALREVKPELERHGRAVAIEAGPYSAAITVLRGGDEEFSYSIRGRAYHPRLFAFPDMEPGEEWRPRAEVILRGGLQKQLDPRRCTRERIVQDFVQEYAKWMGW